MPYYPISDMSKSNGKSERCQEYLVATIQSPNTLESKIIVTVPPAVYTAWLIVRDTERYLVSSKKATFYVPVFHGR